MKQAIQSALCLFLALTAQYEFKKLYHLKSGGGISTCRTGAISIGEHSTTLACICEGPYQTDSWYPGKALPTDLCGPPLTTSVTSLIHHYPGSYIFTRFLNSFHSPASASLAAAFSSIPRTINPLKDATGSRPWDLLRHVVRLVTVY